MAVESFNFEGADWDNPNPCDYRYLESINRAIAERYCYISVYSSYAVEHWQGFQRLAPNGENYLCRLQNNNDWEQNSINDFITSLSSCFCTSASGEHWYWENEEYGLTSEEGCDYESAWPMYGTFETNFANWLKTCKNALCKLRYIRVHMNTHAVGASYRYSHRYESTDPDELIPSMETLQSEWDYAINQVKNKIPLLENQIVSTSRYGGETKVKTDGYLSISGGSEDNGVYSIGYGYSKNYYPQHWQSDLMLNVSASALLFFSTPQTYYKNKAVFYNTESDLGDQITVNYIKRTFYYGNQSGPDEEGTITANELVRKVAYDIPSESTYWKKVEHVSGLTYRFYQWYDNAQNYSYYEVTIPEVSFTFSGFNIPDENETKEYKLYEDSYYGYPNLNKTRQYVYLYSLLQKHNLRIENNQVIFDDDDGLTEWRNSSVVGENFIFQGYGTNISPNYFYVTFKDLIENVSAYKLYLIDSGNFNSNYNHVEQGRIVRYSEDGSGNYWTAIIPSIYGHYFTRYNKDGTLYNGRTVNLTRREIKELYQNDKRWKLSYGNISPGFCWGAQSEYEVRKIMNKNDRFADEDFNGYNGQYYTGSPQDMQITLEELVTHNFNIGKPICSISFSRIEYYIDEGRGFDWYSYQSNGRIAIPNLNGDLYINYKDSENVSQSECVGKYRDFIDTPYKIESYSSIPNEVPQETWENKTLKSNIYFVVDFGVEGGFNFRDDSTEETE